jgi:hypothetical protein
MKVGSPAPTAAPGAPRPPTPATELAPSAAAAAAKSPPPPGRIPAPFYETCSEALYEGTRRGLFDKEAACLGDPRRLRLEATQDGISEADRRETVDWLLGLSFCGRKAGDFLRVERETLGLAVAWLDRVLAARPLPADELRLLACACLQLASKVRGARAQPRASVGHTCAAPLLTPARSPHPPAPSAPARSGRSTTTLTTRSCWCTRGWCGQWGAAPCPARATG